MFAIYSSPDLSRQGPQARDQIVRAGCDVEIDPAALALPYLPILVILGWYLLLRRRDGAAAIAAAMSA
jgi:hypothetical protein